MENLYYLPIYLVENVLFEEPKNGIAVQFNDGSTIQLYFSNVELEKYYRHYYIKMQQEAKGIEFNDEYNIPIGVVFNEKNAILIPFEYFKKEFDKSYLSKFKGIIFNVDGEEKEFFVVQFQKDLLEKVVFDNEDISLDLGKWKIKISTFVLHIILPLLSLQDEKATLVYEEKGENLELFGLLMEPDFDNPEKTKLTLKIL